ncbi:MAG: tyrosine-type recombinase/integrase [Actinobacteria bacterium]|nr:tyrosine-type recombinase/integrase [Actinomycetota bacterium]
MRCGGSRRSGRSSPGRRSDRSRATRTRHRSDGLFAAATGVRPAELAALERRDVDEAGGVVYVHRQLVCGEIKQTKTRRSVRAVPLPSVALEALERLPDSGSPLLFPAPSGGHINLHKLSGSGVAPGATRRWDRADPPAL